MEALLQHQAPGSGTKDLGRANLVAGIKKTF